MCERVPPRLLGTGYKLFHPYGEHSRGNELCHVLSTAHAHTGAQADWHLWHKKAEGQRLAELQRCLGAAFPGSACLLCVRGRQRVRVCYILASKITNRFQTDPIDWNNKFKLSRNIWRERLLICYSDGIVCFRGRLSLLSFNKTTNPATACFWPSDRTVAASQVRAVNIVIWLS